VAELQAAGIKAEVVDGRSTVGGGSLPGTSLPTRLTAITHPNVEGLAAALRRQELPVIGRIQDNLLLLDPRTVLPKQVEPLLAAIIQCARP
jgi:L-seryl-tRNA(Ser) seleniumtransferase